MTQQRLVLLCLLFFLLFLSAALPAAAQSCTVSATNVNFGNYTGATDTPGGSALAVNCPSGSTYTIALNAGQGSGATATVRKMTSGSNTLNYALYQNSSHSTNWGNTSGTGQVSGTGTGSAQTYTVYPQLSSGQQVPPGTYTDTITVNLTANNSAYNTSSTFTVTATVVANCTISASALTFVNYHPTGQSFAQATLTVTCTNTVTYNIGMDHGQGTQASGYWRSMTGPGGQQIPYIFFQDSGATKNWGSTVGTDTEPGTGTGAAQSVTVWGGMNGNSYVTPGTYSDTVTSTITY